MSAFVCVQKVKEREREREREMECFVCVCLVRQEFGGGKSIKVRKWTDSESAASAPEVAVDWIRTSKRTDRWRKSGHKSVRTSSVWK
jgi:hypothetical protein